MYVEERERARNVILRCRKKYEVNQVLNMGSGVDRTKALWRHVKEVTGWNGYGKAKIEGCYDEWGKEVTGSEAVKKRRR